MGQQQLLLLVLGIVIVGLAVVAGINAFDENQQRSSQDAMVQEAFRLATDANAWYLKPTEFGGAGGDATQLTGITADEIGVDNLAYDTPWGTITILGVGDAVTFDLEATGATAPFGCVTFDPAAPQEISTNVTAGCGGGTTA